MLQNFTMVINKSQISVVFNTQCINLIYYQFCLNQYQIYEPLTEQTYKMKQSFIWRITIYLKLKYFWKLFDTQCPNSIRSDYLSSVSKTKCKFISSNVVNCSRFITMSFKEITSRFVDLWVNLKEAIKTPNLIKRPFRCFSYKIWLEQPIHHKTLNKILIAKFWF